MTARQYLLIVAACLAVIFGIVAVRMGVDNQTDLVNSVPVADDPSGDWVKGRQVMEMTDGTRVVILKVVPKPDGSFTVVTKNVDNGEIRYIWLSNDESRTDPIPTKK